MDETLFKNTYDKYRCHGMIKESAHWPFFAADILYRHERFCDYIVDNVKRELIWFARDWAEKETAAQEE